MFNLAIIYIIEDNNLDKSIELLIKSAVQNPEFHHSYVLLSIVLIMKLGLDHERIKNELKKYNCNYEYISYYVNYYIIEFELDLEFEHFLSIYSINFFIYDDEFYPTFCSFTSKDVKIQIEKKKPNIDRYFYEGFGIDL